MENVISNKDITENIDFIKHNFVDEADSIKLRQLSDLERDIQNDFFSVVVLGEFKRGKSTFVNSLIGERLLPADILPTTATINALMWDEERVTYVVKHDGSVEQGKSSLEFLCKFTADEKNDLNNIKYLKVGHPAEILKNDVVIVDTPGVSDINEQRAQVTYDFIPKANAVIFLLDATAPLKRSEKEFIDDHLVKIGIDRILFIANKFDEIDEDEEETVLLDIERRLFSAFREANGELTIQDISVLPMSSAWALKGIEDQNGTLIDQSGINAVKAKIQQIITSSSVAEEKTKRYKIRLMEILNSIQRGLENDRNIQQASVDELKKILDNMDEMLKENGKRKKILSEYIDTEQENVMAMTKKSLVFFHAKLKEEIDESIDKYKGSDFKDYIEQHITTIIKKNMERWVSTYCLAIDQILEKLEKEVVRGLSINFNQRVSFGNCVFGEAITGNKSGYLINVEAKDVSTATTQAGLLSAGAAGIMMLIGGSILLPFISMAAFPILQKKFLENKLKDAKISVKPEIDQQLIKCMCNLSVEVLENITAKINNIRQMGEETFDQLYIRVREQVNEELNRKEKMKEDICGNVYAINDKIMTVENMKKAIII